MRLQGKVALITGAARGQGAEEARMFAKEGAKVVLADVTDQEGTAVAAEIAEMGGDALYVHLDVTNEDEWDAAVQSAVASFGKLDILVNNAGIWRRGHVLETSSDQWDDIMDVNAKGVFLGTKAAIPEMRKAGGGSIVNISSTAGLVGSKTSAAYSAFASSPSPRPSSTRPRASGPIPYTRGRSIPTWVTRSGPTPRARRLRLPGLL